MQCFKCVKLSLQRSKNGPRGALDVARSHRPEHDLNFPRELNSYCVAAKISLCGCRRLFLDFFKAQRVQTCCISTQRSIMVRHCLLVYQPQLPSAAIELQYRPFIVISTCNSRADGCFRRAPSKPRANQPAARSHTTRSLPPRPPASVPWSP